MHRTPARAEVLVLKNGAQFRLSPVGDSHHSPWTASFERALGQGGYRLAELHPLKAIRQHGRHVLVYDEFSTQHEVERRLRELRHRREAASSSSSDVASESATSEVRLELAVATELKFADPRAERGVVPDKCRLGGVEPHTAARKDRFVLEAGTVGRLFFDEKGACAKAGRYQLELQPAAAAFGGRKVVGVNADKLTPASQRLLPDKLNQRRGVTREQQAAWYNAGGSADPAAADAATEAARQQLEVRKSAPTFAVVVAFENAAAAETWGQRMQMQALMALPPLNPETQRQHASRG